jgi:hypothetical protein
MAGPILITAPHGHKMYRGREDLGERRRVHLREAHTTEIALRLAGEVGKLITAGVESTPRGVAPCCSFCVWNCTAARDLDLALLDPNYLHQDEYDSNPWHQALVRFREHCAIAFPGVRPIHVDLHGKHDRAEDFALDVGTQSNVVLMGPVDPARVDRLRAALHAAFGDALHMCDAAHRGGHPPTVAMDPDLHGLWGTDHTDPRTMTTQAVELGIDSFQLEVPLTMRRALVSNAAFFGAFAGAIATIFKALQKRDAVSGEGVPVDVLLGGAATTNADKGRALIAAMLNDCDRHFSRYVGRQI